MFYAVLGTDSKNYIVYMLFSSCFYLVYIQIATEGQKLVTFLN